MILTDKITLVVKDGEEKYNPLTGEYSEVGRDARDYTCQVSYTKDFVDNIQGGIITGKTIKVRFIQDVPVFDYAIYGGRRYSNATLSGGLRNNRSLILEEEVLLGGED